MPLGDSIYDSDQSERRRHEWERLCKMKKTHIESLFLTYMQLLGQADSVDSGGEGRHVDTPKHCLGVPSLFSNKDSAMHNDCGSDRTCANNHFGEVLL